jgi:hypothetical protein
MAKPQIANDPAPVQPESVELPKPIGSPMSKFLVSMSARPVELIALRHNGVQIEAVNEQEAISKFLELNGIKYTIHRINASKVA